MMNGIYRKSIDHFKKKAENAEWECLWPVKQWKKMGIES